MNYTMQFGRRPKGESSSDFLPESEDDDLDEFDDLVEEEDDLVDEEALDEELDFEKPHFHRLGLDYEEEEDE